MAFKYELFPLFDTGNSLHLSQICPRNMEHFLFQLSNLTIYAFKRQGKRKFLSPLSSSGLVYCRKLKKFLVRIKDPRLKLTPICGTKNTDTNCHVRFNNGAKVIMIERQTRKVHTENDATIVPSSRSLAQRCVFFPLEKSKR